MKKFLFAFVILMAVSCNKAADTVVFGTIRTAEEDISVVKAGTTIPLWWLATE